MDFCVILVPNFFHGVLVATLYSVRVYTIRDSDFKKITRIQPLQKNSKITFLSAAIIITSLIVKSNLNMLSKCVISDYNNEMK